MTVFFPLPLDESTSHNKKKRGYVLFIEEVTNWPVDRIYLIDGFTLLAGNLAIKRALSVGFSLLHACRAGLPFIFYGTK